MPNRPNGTGFLDESKKGAPQGVAPLDADKRVPLPNSPRDLAAFDVRNFGASPTATAAVNNAAFYAAVTAAGRRPVYVGERYKVSLTFTDQDVNLNCYGGGVLVQELGSKALDITNNAGAAIPVTVNAPMVFGPNLPLGDTDTQVFTSITVAAGNYADFEGGQVYHLESKDAYPFAAVENTLTDPTNVNVWKAEFVPLLGIGMDISTSTGSLQEGRTIVGATSGASAMVDSVVQMGTSSTSRKILVRKITKNGTAGFQTGETIRYNGTAVGVIDSQYLAMNGVVSGAYTTSPNLRKMRQDLVTKLDVVVDIPTGLDSNAIVGTTLRNASRSIYLHGLVGAEVKARGVNAWTRFLVAQSCYLGAYEAQVDGLPNHALETESAYGYAFEAHGASSDFTVRVNATRVRHGFTTNSSPATYANGVIFQFGTPKRIKVTGTVTRSFSAAFDTHAGAEGIVFTDCDAIQPTSGNRYLTTPSGFNDRSFGTVYRNVSVNGGRYGIVLAGMAYPSELPYTTRVEGLTARNILQQGVKTSTLQTVVGGAVRVVLEACDVTMDGRPSNTPYYHNAYYLDAGVDAVVHNCRSAGFNGSPLYARYLKSLVLDGHRSDYSAFTSGATGVRVEGAIAKLAIHDYGVVGGTDGYPAAALRNIAGDSLYNLTGTIGAFDGNFIPPLLVSAGAPTVAWRDRPGRIEQRTNNNYTYIIGSPSPIHVYDVALGSLNNRTFTLPTDSSVPNGETVRIVRTANATGTATLTVVANAVTLKQLEIGTWVQVAYTGTSWIVVGAGTL